MGCDIHSMVEVYYPEYTYSSKNYMTGETVPVTIPGEWRHVKAPMWDNTYYNDDKPISAYNTPYTSDPYSGRNYFLFSWLAGVRNYREHITPIAEPRGVPEDASKKWKKTVKSWGADLHSTSYFTLQELIDSEQKAKETLFTEHGVVSLKQYLELKEQGKVPDSWCMSTSAPTMSATEYESLTDSQKRELPSGEWNGQHIATSWTLSLYDSVGWFYEHTVERMKNLVGNRTDTTQVRLVFGFDN